MIDGVVIAEHRDHAQDDPQRHGAAAGRAEAELCPPCGHRASRYRHGNEISKNDLLEKREIPRKPDKRAHGGKEERGKEKEKDTFGLIVLHVGNHPFMVS